jgi:hypothetical protein
MATQANNGVNEIPQGNAEGTLFDLASGTRGRTAWLLASPTGMQFRLGRVIDCGAPNARRATPIGNSPGHMIVPVAPTG